MVINLFIFLILQELANGKVLLRLAHLYEVCLSAYNAKSGHSLCMDTNLKDFFRLPLSSLKEKI